MRLHHHLELSLTFSTLKKTSMSLVLILMITNSIHRILKKKIINCHLPLQTPLRLIIVLRDKVVRDQIIKRRLLTSMNCQQFWNENWQVNAVVAMEAKVTTNRPQWQNQVHMAIRYKYSRFSLKQLSQKKAKNKKIEKVLGHQYK